MPHRRTDKQTNNKTPVEQFVQCDGMIQTHVYYSEEGNSLASALYRAFGPLFRINRFFCASALYFFGHFTSMYIPLASLFYSVCVVCLSHTSERSGAQGGRWSLLGGVKFFITFLHDSDIVFSASSVLRGGGSPLTPSPIPMYGLSCLINKILRSFQV